MSGRAEQSKLPRWLWLMLAYVFLGLGAIGAFLPLLPTTPFLLLTAGCAARGSERLHDRLYGHPRWGKLLRQWDENRAIPLQGKLLAVAGLTIGWAFAASRFEALEIRLGLALILAAVGLYVATRPNPQRSGDIGDVE